MRANIGLWGILATSKKVAEPLKTKTVVGSLYGLRITRNRDYCDLTLGIEPPVSGCAIVGHGLEWLVS